MLFPLKFCAAKQHKNHKGILKTVSKTKMSRLTFSFCSFVAFFFWFCVALNSSVKEHLRGSSCFAMWKFQFPCHQLLWLIFPFRFCRCCLYHDCDLPVESVSNHCCKLSSTLHPQVLEAQVFSSKLLQAYLVKVIRFPWFFTLASLQTAQSLCFSVYGFMLD